MSQAGTAAPTTFAELWDEVKTEALNAWAVIKADAVKAENVIVPKIDAGLKLVLSQMKTVAVNTVLNLAQAEFNNLTGTQKNVITTQTIIQVALQQGKTLAQQDAAMLAQQAFNEVSDAAHAVQ